MGLKKKKEIEFRKRRHMQKNVELLKIMDIKRVIKLQISQNIN